VSIVVYVFELMLWLDEVDEVEILGPDEMSSSGWIEMRWRGGMWKKVLENVVVVGGFHF